MAIRLTDYFNGTAGVDLGAHTPDVDVVGSGWIDETANVAELDGTGALKWIGAANSRIDVGVSDQVVTTNINWNGGASRWSVNLRHNGNSDATQDSYTFIARNDISPSLDLHRRETAYVYTQLASNNNVPWTLTDNHETIASAIGAALKFVVDGIAYIDITDVGITTGQTYISLYTQNYTDNLLRFYDISVSDTYPTASFAKSRVRCGFDGATGTDIEAYVPNLDYIGTGFVQRAANELELDGAGGLKWSVFGSQARIDVGVTDQSAKILFNAGGANNRPLIGLRSTDNGSTLSDYYGFNLQVASSTGNANFRIFRSQAGTETELAGLEVPYDLNITYEIEARAIGQHLQFFMNGALIVEAADNALTAGTFAMLMGAARNNANARFYRFEVYDETRRGFQQDSGTDGIVSIEADNYDKNTPADSSGHTWDLILDPQYTNGRAMRALPDTGTAVGSGYAPSVTPRLDYQINFVKTGTHYIWLRIEDGGVTGDSDSVHFGLDGNVISTAEAASAIDYSTHTLHWSNHNTSLVVLTMNVATTGLHTLNMWMREDGVIIDKILLTTNSGYTPTLEGPTESSNLAFGLYYSASSSFTSLASLQDATVSGNIYVMSAPDSEITGVDFYLDDPTMSGAAYRSDVAAPFTLENGIAFDTTALSNGVHTITMATTNLVYSETYSFTVYNAPAGAKLYDVFWDNGGTDISAHVADIDLAANGWVDDGANLVELDGIGGLRFNAGGKGAWCNVGFVDQLITENFNAGGQNNNHTLQARRDNAATTALSNGYELNIRPNDVTYTLLITKYVGGSGTNLAGNTTATINNATDYEAQFEVVGSGLVARINGVDYVTTSDSEIGADTYVGVYHNSGAGYVDNSLRVFDFLVTQLVPSEILLAGATSVALGGTADLTTEINLAGSDGVAVSESADLTTEVNLAASAGVTIAGAAGLTTEINLGGTASIAISESADLTTEINLTGADGVTLNGAADLTTEINLSAADGIALGGSVDLITEINLSGAANITISESADLLTDSTLAGSASVSIGGSADLTTEINMAATAGVSISENAMLDTIIALSAQAGILFGESADLITEINLGGAASIALGATADLTTDSTMSSTAGITLDSSAQLTTEINLAGTGNVTLSGVAALTTGSDLEGGASFSIGGSADLATEIDLQGSATVGISGTAALTSEITLATAIEPVQISGFADLSTEINLSGNAGLNISEAGDLTTEIGLQATAGIQLDQISNLTTEIDLAGAASMSLGGSAALTVAITTAHSAPIALAMTDGISINLEIPSGAGATVALDIESIEQIGI